MPRRSSIGRGGGGDLKRIARVLTATVLVAMAAVLGTGRVFASGVGTEAVANCPTSALDVWLKSEPSAPSSRYYSVEFTNLSQGACSIAGYPRVLGVNLAGARLGIAARRGTEAMPRITLEHGQTAYALLRITVAQVIVPCHLATAAGLRVYPPGQTVSRFVPYPFLTCSRRGQGNLTIRAVRSGDHFARVLRVPRAAASAAKRCKTPGLDVWLNSEVSGATGGLDLKLEFTNLSGHRCTMFGYPGVSWVDLAGRQIGAPGSREPNVPPRVVTLAPGATATAPLRASNVFFMPAPGCNPLLAAGMRVYPPNEKSSRIAPMPLNTCVYGGGLRIRPVEKG